MKRAIHVSARGCTASSEEEEDNPDDYGPDAIAHKREPRKPLTKKPKEEKKEEEEEKEETTTCVPCTDATGTSTASTASMEEEEEDNHRELEEWKGGGRGSRSSWKGEAKKVYWHKEYKFYVVGIKNGGRVIFMRACINCDKKTLRFSEARCGKAACGGEREVKIMKPCEMVDVKTDEPCTNGARHTNDDGVRMCVKHWVAEDPDARGCPGCKVKPRPKNRDDGLCGHCVEKDNVEAARDAQRSALEDLMEEEGIEEWPGPEAAEPQTRYAMLNRLDGHRPYVVIKSGKQAYRACEHRGCRQVAQPNPATKEYKWCCLHGSGVRCQVDYGALEALMEEEGIDKWPGAEAAEPRTRYAMLNRKDGYKPFVVVKSGKQAMRACEHRGCCHAAQRNPDTKEKKWCIQHGGGRRCATGVHLEEVPPHAKYTLGATARSYGADGAAYARPEWEGTPCCMGCLKHLDPDNVAVKLFIRKEHLVVSEVGSEFFRRDLGHLVRKATGIVVHDCQDGESHRRKDLNVDVGPPLLLDYENDENQHKDRQLSCERKKLAGHLVDRGVVGLTKAEAALWDPPHPDDVALEALKDTPEDTLAMRQLRKARGDATKRLLKEYAYKRRESLQGADEKAILPKLHCLRFNCDAYVAADGTRIGGLFTTTGTQDENAVLKLKPTKAFGPAIRRLVDRILELRELAKDEAWMDAHKEWETEYMRYDGCDRRGYDPNGTVAAAQAARSVEAEEGVIMDSDGEEGEEGEEWSEEDE